MYLGAHVLLPEGFDEHPDARYPLVIYHGHFPRDFGGFREEPPDPEPEVRATASASSSTCYNRTVQEHAHQFYKDWTGPDFPRVLIVEIQHANPYYDDSYAVNSANLGPYGDAITYELIPYLEKKYRGLGAGLGALHVRRLHRRLGGDGRAGVLPRRVQRRAGPPAPTRSTSAPTPWSTSTRTRTRTTRRARGAACRGPAHRNYLGHVSSTLEQANRCELVLGTKSRSGEQWDIWEAVYSPVGAGRLSAAHLGQADRASSTRRWPRTGGRTTTSSHILRRDWEKGLGREARGQDPHLRRRHGQLLPEQRRLPGRGVPEDHDEPALRRRGGLRRPRRALLERRPHAPERASRACATTRCSRRRSSSGSRRRRPRAADVTSWRY